MLEVLRKRGCLYLAVCDVRVSSEWFAGRPREMNNKGVVDEYRRPESGIWKGKGDF